MGPDQFLAPANQIMVEVGRMKTMRGVDLKNWRKEQGYSQKALMMELGVRSRATISGWENSAEELPRLVQLALRAVEDIPEVRNVSGRRTSIGEKRVWRKQRSER